jgi:hypothetical protein
LEKNFYEKKYRNEGFYMRRNLPSMAILIEIQVHRDLTEEKRNAGTSIAMGLSKNSHPGWQFKLSSVVESSI